MKMKNVLMILLSLALVFTMAGGVAGNSDSMTVKYEVLNPGYTFTIPPDVTFEGTTFESDGAMVNVTSLLIGFGKELQVTMKSTQVPDGATIYNLTSGSGETGSYIPYYVNNTDTHTQIANGAVILSIPAGKKHPLYPGVKGRAGIGNYVNLTFKTTPGFIANATHSGLHQDQLTFEFSVKP